MPRRHCHGCWQRLPRTYLEVRVPTESVRPKPMTLCPRCWAALRVMVQHAWREQPEVRLHGAGWAA